MKNIEQIVKKRLLELNFTQQQICEEIGILPPALQKIFRDNKTSIKTLEKIAKSIQVPVTTFFETDNDIEENKSDFIQIKKDDYIKLLQTANKNLNEEIEEKNKTLERLKNI